MTGSPWSRQEEAGALAPGDVHVWRVDLDREPGEVAPFQALLPHDERERAARFHFETDRVRYIVAHHALRELLGRYRGAGTCRDRFELGPNGKPAVGGGPHFNISHSRGVGLVAIAERDVGVDVEGIDPRTEIELLAERFFSRAERTALLAITPERRREGFYHIWSQKEAYLKGRGEGVTLGLDHFDVVADPMEGAGLLDDRKDPLATRHWSLLSLDPGAGFLGALAFAGGKPAVRCFEWS